MICEQCDHAGDFPYCNDCITLDGCPTKFERTTIATNTISVNKGDNNDDK